ncbi:peroxisomal membrane protein 11B-like [Anopheles cruzii]|uniref:peroxisomal membrane protein 11B-like n=1 Tax=Anopheles cruzii TaxID=68878 RepID=UPI0022EC9478|nr:peroxisomal membrane protein 11B-like [Anopheles cruzii]
MDLIIKLNSQTVGKDKIARLVQYSCRALWASKEANNLGAKTTESIQVLKLIEGILSSFRKLLRFGKGFEVLYAAGSSVEMKQLSQQLFIVLGKVSSGLFLLADHVVWLSRSGISKGVDATEWLARSNRFWLISIAMNLCRDLQELYRLTVYYSRSNIRNLARTVSVIYNENKPLVVDTVKNVCDIFIPLNGLGYVKVSNQTIGILGAISSIMGLLPLIYPRLKF